MVHVQQKEDARSKIKSTYSIMARSFDGGCSKSRLEIQDMRRLKKRVSTQVPSNFCEAHDDRVSNHKPKRVRDTSSTNKCGKKHYGDPGAIYLI